MADRHRRLPPDISRLLYVRNLPFKISSSEMYDIFGKYGGIRQIRIGDSSTTRGTAFVVYDNIYDAKNAVEKLGGFNVGGRYLVLHYYQSNKGSNASVSGKDGVEGKRREVEALRQEVEGLEAKE